MAYSQFIAAIAVNDPTNPVELNAWIAAHPTAIISSISNRGQLHTVFYSLSPIGNSIIATVPAPALTSTAVQITSTGVNQILLAANATRQKAILFFSSGIWNIKLGVEATATSFTYVSASANTLIEISPWAGEIDAICTTSGKLVNVTECSS